MMKARESEKSGLRSKSLDSSVVSANETTCYSITKYPRNVRSSRIAPKKKDFLGINKQVSGGKAS